MLIVYFLLLLVLSTYSYSLIDPNLTFFQTKWWELFRERMIQIGYYQRELSWMIYAIIVLLLFIFHFLFIKKYKQTNAVRLAFLVGIALTLSYPFLSHDFFNYLFDTRILTFYHQNPYLHRALDFPNDPWLRFMHWTHRSYPYGPVFLLISIIPSFLSFGKFILNFLFFKITFVFFYLLAVYSLQRMNKKWAVIFATHPLILIEGLASSHNDLIGVSLAIVGTFFLFEKKDLTARLFFIASAGIKYITAPFIFLSRNKHWWNRLVFVAVCGVLLYFSFGLEIQPWYFISLFVLLPFFDRLIGNLSVFFAGLLFSYYPYIRLGGWDTGEKVALKHSIIGVFLAANLIQYIIFEKMKFRPQGSVFKSKP